MCYEIYILILYFCFIALVVAGDQTGSIFAFLPLEPTAMDTDDPIEPMYSLLGHKSNVCALDTGYGLVVSGSWDKTARVWKNEKLLYELTGHEQAVWAVLVLSKSLILTGSADKTIRLWENGKLKRVFKGHSDAVRGLAKLSDTTFVSCGNDASVRLWDISTESPFQELYGHTSFVYSVAVDPLSGDIFSAGEDRSFRVWRGGECIQAVTLPFISAWTISVNPDNGDVAVGGSDFMIRVFSRDPLRVASEEELKSFEETVASSGIGKDQVGSINKESLETSEALKTPGKAEGEIKMIRTEKNTVEAYQWSSDKWVKIGEVVGSAGSTTKKLYNGVEYDYVFDVDIQEGAPVLKLPYNVTENPFDAARRFLEDNELPLSYLDTVVDFITKNSEGVDLSEPAPAQDPYGTRYIPGQSSSTQAPTPAAQKSATPDNLKILPVKTFVQLVSFKPAPIINAIRVNNKKQGDSETLSDAEISIIENGLSTTPISEQAASSIFEVLSKALDSWPSTDILPILDVLRITIPSLYKFPPVVMLQYLVSSLDADLPKHCLLALRGLVNLFSSPNTQAVNSVNTDGTRATIFNFVQEILASKANEAKPEPRNLAISSLCYNYAVYSWKKGNSATFSDKLVESFVKFLSYINDSESQYRMWLAIGTVLVDSSSKGKTDVKRALGEIKPSLLDEDRFQVVLSDIHKLTG